ncbi:WXG100 family type VII secretion target [Streptomyces sp. NPDC001985]|uniref:WXG100 family type VII secretion target n=1 Tax=Streptomyces sp. NPDC001985 TaxID=3154406 RepID=UPI0033169434
MSGVNSTSFAGMKKGHELLVNAGNDLRREHEGAKATTAELQQYWQSESSTAYQKMMGVFDTEMQNALSALEEIELKIEQISGAQVRTDEDSKLAVSEMNRALEAALQGP